MNFQAYAHSFQVFPKLGLDRIRALLARLGHPEEQCRCIHIAGTNGKGSVAEALSAVFAAAGKRTGLYTSPNLVRVNERICVDGRPISDGALSALIGRVETAAREVERECGEMPTPFEIWTASAFLHFAAEHCDIVVLEVGLGGEFDATNVISRCEAAVLAHIDYDHMAQLGKTLPEIARAKCGIIKEGCPVVTGPQTPEVMEVIRRTAAKKHAPLSVCEVPSPGRFEGMYEIVDLPALPALKLPLAGLCQIANMALAVQTAQLLGVPADVIRRGLAKTRHPGRMEVLREKPLLLYDGGHNPDGIRSLVASLARYLPQMRFTVIFAAMKDKDTAPSLALLKQVADTFIFTAVSQNPRSMTPEEATERAEKAGIDGRTAPTLAQAIALAGDTPTLICGSLYLYADLPKDLRRL